MMPVQVLPHSETNNKGSRHGESSRQCCRLTLRRQQVWQHRHNEDAESKACRPLNEAGENAQQEYAYNGCGHLFLILV